MTQTMIDQLPRQQLVDFCRRHHIRKLAIFGSALRDDFTSASDLGRTYART
jgi:predicted nucleotidyltransferase